jgi:putative membrane protein
MSYPMIRRLGPLAAAVVLAAGCASREEMIADRTVDNTSGNTSDEVKHERRMDDAQIVDVLLAANHAEIEEAQLVLSKTQNPEVRAFAQMMLDEHTRMRDDTRALAQRLNLTPDETATSLQLRAESEQSLALLRAQEGTAFDQAYMASQVVEHEQLLDQIGGALIPSARNPELKQFIATAAPKIEQHWKHAKQLQSALGSPPIGANR